MTWLSSYLSGADVQLSCWLSTCKIKGEGSDVMPVGQSACDVLDGLDLCHGNWLWECGEERT